MANKKLAWDLLDPQNYNQLFPFFPDNGWWQGMSRSTQWSLLWGRLASGAGENSWEEARAIYGGFCHRGGREDNTLLPASLHRLWQQYKGLISASWERLLWSTTRGGGQYLSFPSICCSIKTIPTLRVSPPPLGHRIGNPCFPVLYAKTGKRINFQSSCVLLESDILVLGMEWSGKFIAATTK